MELVQARLVTEDLAGLAAFYAGLVGAKVPLNEYYVEVPAGPGVPAAAGTVLARRGSGTGAFAGNNRYPTHRSAILQKVAASAPGRPALRRPAARPG